MDRKGFKTLGPGKRWKILGHRYDLALCYKTNCRIKLFCKMRLITQKSKFPKLYCYKNFICKNRVKKSFHAEISYIV